MTANYSLMDLADLRRGQTILIHGAAGHIGQAALTIAHHLGAKVFATVSSGAEREELVKKYKLSSTCMFSEQATSLKQSVLNLTQGNGVDVVFNPLTTYLHSGSWACIAVCGHYIQVREQGCHPNFQMDMPSLNKSATFTSLDLASLISCRPQKVPELLDKVMAMNEVGAFLPSQHVTRMSIANVEDAFGMIQAGKHIGKVVFEADENTQVKVLSTRHTTTEHDRSQLSKNAKYVVAGGPGDLGQRLCHLMASRGAKHIAILSRRALNHNRKGAL